MSITIEYERDGGDQPLILDIYGQEDLTQVQEFCAMVNDAAGSMTIIGPDGEDLSAISDRYDPHELCVLATHLDGQDTDAKIAFMSQQQNFGAIENFDTAFRGEFNNMTDFGICMDGDLFDLNERLEPYFDGLKFGWDCANDYEVVTAEGTRPSDDDKIYVFDLNLITDKPGVRM